MIERSIESFTVRSSHVLAVSTLRLDATFYSQSVAHALTVLEDSGMEIRQLGEITERVYMPGRFRRTYVSEEYGVPFLQGSHIIQFQPADVKYLSIAVHKNLDKLIIRSGWILLTRSGTAGRVALVPPQWDGWAASEHVFRIIPEESSGCPAGYLAVFLSSPLGQAQLRAQIYGAVVDELTEDQVRSIYVPIPRTLEQRERVQKVNDLALLSLSLRAEAASRATESSEELMEYFGS